MIVCLLLFVTTLLSASDVVATITAYNKASLSGDVRSTMAVSFSNSNHSKGQLTAGNEATMSIINFPKGVITKVVVYVKSNAKSGAGSLAISIDNIPVAKIAESSFSEWQKNGYSTSFVPIEFEGNWRTVDGSELVCRMTASENSLEWEKMVVTYLQAAPEPQVVTLSWLDAEGKRQTSELKEQSAESGVVLPQCEVAQLPDNWTFVGWSKEKLTNTYTSQPTMWKAGEYFYPQTSTTLFAVYQQAPQLTPVPQTTSFQSGEYAIACKGIYYYGLLTGEVVGKYAASSPVDISIDANGQYVIREGYVSPYNRYQIDFEPDSLSIKYAMTGTYIGHDTKKLTSKKSKWAWHEYKNHSIELSFGQVEKSSGVEGQVLWLNADGLFEAVTLYIGQDYEYLLLFDVSDVPTSPGNVKWTCCPFGQDAIESVMHTQPARKVMRNGVLYIEYNNAEYDVLGRKITS